MLLSILDSPATASGAADTDPPETRALRASLVRKLVAEGDLETSAVRSAMGRVPRHLFAPALPLVVAYANNAQPIGFEQTISQPTIVAMMTEALELEGSERVLEIGTGSGYQTAVLSLLAREVYTVEIVRPLGEQARERLSLLGYANVHVRIGDGYAGWPERAPFDRIILTAAPPELPRALLDQLASDGLLVAPVGAARRDQWLVRVEKRGGELSSEHLGPVHFVPMVKKA
jgi:protein-L-isoaspartate(D-aspartate) O-methyltransferase